MPIPDGRIRSRDLDNGSVNSRVIDDLKSSNWNGDPNDPDTSPGAFGWAIFKSGLLIANNAIFRGTIQAARILSGVLHIGGTGKVTAGADEDNPTTTLDASGLTVGDAPVVIDADGLDIGSGLTVIDSTGVQVGTDVVMDSAGLHLGGGDARALDVDENDDSTNSATLTDSFADLVSTTLTIPSWANSALVIGIATIQSGNDSGGNMGVITRVRIDGTDGVARQSDLENGENTSVAAFGVRIVSSPGTSVTVSARGQRTGGTDQSNVQAQVLAYGVALRS